MSGPLFAPAGGGIARVALPVPVDSLFDYSIPASLADEAQPGCRVLVAFRQQHLTGVLIERVETSRFEGRLRPIEKLVDPEPVLSRAMLEILREAADDVLCPLGIAVATALPSGSAPRVLRGFALTPRGVEAMGTRALAAPLRAILEALARAPATEARLRRRVRGAGLSARLRGLERDGLIGRRPLEQAPTARAATERWVEVAPGVDTVEPARGALARAPQPAALRRRPAAAGASTRESLRREFPTAASLVRSLAARGLVVEHERALERDVLGAPLEESRAVPLTPDQTAVLEPIRDAVRARRAETFLLHGVTGSGKTEIYLQAVGEALREGRQALVLVPEITLTHQILARLRGRFGDGLAVLHSGLRPGERLEQWQRLRAGTTPIAVGARSALFAPLENLGVIVLDEEHDSAYKNDEGFRYHARSLAARRAARAGCPVILGSATPSLETRHAADTGELRRLVLTNRIGGRPLPAVEIVDLNRERERAPRGRRVVLSRALRSAVADTLAAGGQSILFLNRRGFSTQVLCFECGFAERCEHCDIALVFHATDQVLRCHYCDYTIPPPRACSGCGAPEIALMGLGTQRLEEEVRTGFPAARIARLDRDTASRRGHTESVLRALQARNLDILIGTQMVAKGHDFPGVRLVGVVMADVGLHLPDFRAAERTLQLLTQVAGRAGRDRSPGRVVVQTFAPGHYAIEPVQKHDYESFYREEIVHRQKLGYPPFGQLVHVLVSAEDAEQALAAAAALAGKVEKAGLASAPVEMLGPAPSPLSRLRGKYRFQLLLKSVEPEPLRRAARLLATAAARVPDGVTASVDTQPVNML